MYPAIDRRMLGLVMAIALGVAGCSRAPSDKDAPPPQAPAPPSVPAAPRPSAEPSGTPAVNADAQAMATFEARVKEYAELHNKLEDKLPHLSKDSSPLEIDKHQREMARLVQEARANTREGDIFTPESQVVIKRLLQRVFGGPDGKELRASIMDENPTPEAVKLKVNDRYPDTVPLSTVPPQVLQGLPKLPDEMEFRFIGSHLVLLDVHAHIIVDIIRNALPS